MIGTRFGPYEILEEIGKGGMATVYRARQASVDRDVAIKVIHRGTSSDPASVQRFQREARLIARLEHPHILPVYDFDGAHDPPYIVMRYLDSGTLEEVMAQGLLPEDEITYLVRQVCSALDYAHRQGIIHRDIKPSNIMIDREGNAFVADFGIARIAAESASLQLTIKGAIIGTPDYMSPEQAMGSADVDYRTDLYSLGVMLFQVLTGRLPFAAAQPLGVLMMHIQQPPPSILEYRPLLSPTVDEVIQKALAKKREDRYQTASELGNALTKALGGQVSENPNRLREFAGTSQIRRVESKPAGNGALKGASAAGSSATPSEQFKQIAAAYINAAEYAEIVEQSNGSEAARRAMNALWGVFEQIINRSRGVIFTRTDNELLVLWGADAAREDDAERAVRSAIEMQDALRSLGAPFLIDTSAPPGEDQLPLNIGIHSGVALLTPGEKTGAYNATGATISLANRLMQAAYGAILITHDIYRQVRGVFDVLPDVPLRVRGRAEGVETYRVTALKPRAFRINTRGVEGVETRMVGREAELKHLENLFLNATEDAETQVVTITGEAGVGKTRLVDEFDQWSELRPESYRIFYGRATVGLQDRPYALIRDLMAFRFEIMDDDAPQVVLRKLEAGVAGLVGKNTAAAHLIGYLCGYDLSGSPHVKPLLGDPGLLVEQGQAALVHFFTHLGRKENVVIELEDLHHADDASLDLLNTLFSADDALHLLVICVARPLLFARRPDWGSGQAFHTRLELKPLDKRESRDLVREILQKVDEVPRALRDLLVERAEGNPYYMEELVKMLLDDRVIVRETDQQWRVEESRLGALNVPPTLSGLLEARFDTLLYPEKLTLQRASVFGRVFYDEALKAMDEADQAAHGRTVHVADLPGVLSNLEKRDFIDRREVSAFAGSAEYIIAQAMLRDTIYSRLLERQLRTYHLAAAHWLAGLERANEHLAQIAEHYQKAGEPLEAARALRQAGDQASRRGLIREAIDLYERALALLPEDDPAERLALLIGLGSQTNLRGDLPKTAPLLTEAMTLAEAQNNQAAQAILHYQMAQMETTRGSYAAALAHLAQALPLARQSAQRSTLANVLYGLADTHFRMGNLAEAMEAVRECIELAGALGDEMLRHWAMNRLATTELMNKANDQGKELLEETLAFSRRVGDHRMEASALTNLGNIALSEHNWSDAVSYMQEAVPLTHQTEDLIGIVITSANLAVACLRTGAPERVKPLLVDVLRAARKMQSTANLLNGVSLAGDWLLCTNQTARGLQLLGLARSHPASTSDNVLDIEEALRFYRQERGLSEEEIRAGMEAGKQLDMEQVVNELLGEE